MNMSTTVAVEKSCSIFETIFLMQLAYQVSQRNGLDRQVSVPFLPGTGQSLSPDYQ